MASPNTIKKLVRTLCEAHHRKPNDETFDAYRIALAEYDDNEIDSALTAALRQEREFMPPPGIVAGFAKECRSNRLRYASSDDERRLICSICQDSGSVLIVNREWLAEHASVINREWLVAGWMREAHRWCRQNILTSKRHNGHKALFYYACCFCKCLNAQRHREQVHRYLEAMRSGEYDERKSPRPAFGQLYDPGRDCMIDAPNLSAVEAALLDFCKQQSEQQTLVPF